MSRALKKIYFILFRVHVIPFIFSEFLFMYLNLIHVELFISNFSKLLHLINMFGLSFKLNFILSYTILIENYKFKTTL